MSVRSAECLCFGCDKDGASCSVHLAAIENGTMFLFLLILISGLHILFIFILFLFIQYGQVWAEREAQHILHTHFFCFLGLVCRKFSKCLLYPCDLLFQRIAVLFSLCHILQREVFLVTQESSVSVLSSQIYYNHVQPQHAEGSTCVIWWATVSSLLRQGSLELCQWSLCDFDRLPHWVEASLATESVLTSPLWDHAAVGSICRSPPI